MVVSFGKPLNPHLLNFVEKSLCKRKGFFSQISPEILMVYLFFGQTRTNYIVVHGWNAVVDSFVHLEGIKCYNCVGFPVQKSH